MKTVIFRLAIVTLCVPICQASGYANVTSARANAIASGQYQNRYPDSYGIRVTKGRFSVVYDDAPPEPWQPLARAKFTAVKSGVFYNSFDKKYYCALTKEVHREGRKNISRGFDFVCTRKGWQGRRYVR